jgi:hypothetical protein
MVPRNLHIVHLLIRQNLPVGQVGFLVFPHEHWKSESGQPILALPAKKTVADPLDPFLQGTSIEAFVDRIVHEELGLATDHYALEQELEPTELAMPSPTHGGLTDYTTPYQMQGIEFTWSFFTHRDPQDCHVHGAPVVELYGVLEGSLEVWWKPYYERGTSAWSHRVLQAGDWLEVDSLQCHIVHWLTVGRGRQAGRPRQDAVHRVSVHEAVAGAGSGAENEVAPDR